MASQEEIDIVRAMAGGTRTRNLTDARVSQIIDDNWNRITEETGIAVSDLQATYYSIATQIVRRYAVAEVLIGSPEMVDTRNSLLREAQNMIGTLAKPDPSDPDSEIIVTTSDYETYPLNAGGTIWLGSLSGRPRYRTTFGQDSGLIV
jgi:hypothetical protein